MNDTIPAAGATAVRAFTRRGMGKALLALTLCTTLFGGTAASASDTQAVRDRDWIGTWTASPSDANPAGFTDQTLRLIVHTSIGGQKVRVRLSNAFGTQPVAVGAVRIGLQSQGASIVAGSDRPLTFGGKASAVIPRGAQIVSDPVAMAVKPLSNLAVTVYLPGSTGPISEHSLAVQTNYASPPGNYVDAVNLPVQATRTSWSLLSAVEVGTGEVAGDPVPGPIPIRMGNARAVVTLGDSITDGYGSTVDANRRWPNVLAQRLQDRHMNVAVLNQGISGNRVLHDGQIPIFGENALARFDRDVLAHPHVKFLVVMEGINDFGHAAPGTPEAVTADDIIQGYKQIILRAHARGIKVYGATLTPYRGTIFPGYFNETGELNRMAVNHWIRTSGAFDAVIDFDAVVRDPANPSRMLPAYDVGDHLHPNDAGYQAMGQSVNLSLFADDGASSASAARPTVETAR
ncbi:SGNH/GDSL hydrolase family protein [Ideonella sp. BN130291]|uniref:SGNH/GDSL hydrolase family protein n=1 Tax=Ideonella sp. BN130291 TaxID=3112940 RepID=UPI002E268AB3|nr:SGNH/GDSL hydrolase family protein [Ideonella sp. BN130291]